MSEIAPNPEPEGPKGPPKPDQNAALPTGPGIQDPSGVGQAENGGLSKDETLIAAELDEKVPEGVRRFITEKTYGGYVEHGVMSQEEAEQAAGDGIEVALKFSDEELVAVNNDASVMLEDISEWETPDTDDQWANLAGFMDRYESAQDAAESVSRAFEVLPYLDPDRAERVFGMALSDHDLNDAGMLSVARGLANLTMERGSLTLPLWNEAGANAEGDPEKEQVVNLAAHGTIGALERGIESMKQDPAADPEVMHDDEVLVAQLKQLVGADTQGAAREPAREQPGLAQLPEEQRQEAVKRFEQRFDRSKLAGDPQWN